jgi:class 3 adenylate cyclase
VTGLPETEYARTADGIHIAYQVFGEGPVDLVVMPTAFSHLEVEWEAPSLARFLRRLSSFSRLIRLNTRGTGLSDPVSVSDTVTLEHRAEDLMTVLDAAGSDRAALLGGVWAGQMMIFFAATHPERTAALVLAGTGARFAWAPDYAWGIPPSVQESRAREAGGRGVGLLRYIAPSVVDDPEFVSWWERLQRHLAGPGARVANTAMVFGTDVRPLLPTIQVPTLVLCRSGDPFRGRDHGRYLAEHIPGAKLVELPGEDNLMYAGDSEALVEEVEEFLTGARHEPDTDRVLATVLFTDIVSSTDHIGEMGDHRWRELLITHDTRARAEVERFRGRVVKSTGDGVLATFDGPGRAIRCALAMRESMRPLGIEIRAGLHTGEIELLGDDVAGMAVHIGSRVSALAAGGEVLVSSTVKDLVAGSGIEFDERGEHELKGVPGAWRLYSAIT